MHRVRALMDEVFGAENFVSQIAVMKTSGSTEVYLSNVTDFLLWYSRQHEGLKYRQFMLQKVAGGIGGNAYTFVETDVGERRRIGSLAAEEAVDGRMFRLSDMTSQSVGRAKGEGAASWFGVEIRGRTIR